MNKTVKLMMLSALVLLCGCSAKPQMLVQITYPKEFTLDGPEDGEGYTSRYMDPGLNTLIFTSHGRKYAVVLNVQLNGGEGYVDVHPSDLIGVKQIAEGSQ